MHRYSLPPRSTALLLALVAALLLFRLGDVPLVGPDEPRYARVAVEMHRAGEWVTPTLQGRPWLEKPVLYYWLAAAAYAVLGETETAARLPSVAAGVLMAGFTVLMGARLYGTAAGLHAGFVLGTSLLFFVYGRAASMDMLLAALVTAATGFAGLRALGIAGRLAMVAAWACAGLATLAKGPLGLLLPALVLGAYVLLTRSWRLLREALSPAGLLAFVLVAGPWYFLILRETGGAFVDVFLLDHNLQRFTSAIHRHPGPPWFYLPLVVGGLFPWSGLLLPGLAAVRARASRRDLFVLLWFALPLVFFSAAGSKLPGYVLPCLPPLALLAGRAADALAAGEAEGPPGTGPRAVAILTLVLSSVVGALPLVLLRQGEPLWRLALPLAVWAVLLGLAFSRRVRPDPAGALRLLRVGAAGFLLLLASAAPPLLAARESGRSFFRAAAGREVLAWGAWRTAWMAGYFYNDGKVREAGSLEEVAAAARNGPALVLCGPGERQRLQALGGFTTAVLARGPRDNVLLRLDPRPGGP